MRRARLLIVTEGSKTEPLYLRECANALGLADLQYEIRVGGASPDQVFKTAQKLYKPEDYSEVYCVFDGDVREHFDTVLQKIGTLKEQGNPFYAVTSTPCFEFWFLLHFGYSSAPIAAKGVKDRGENQKTMGEAAVNALKHKPGLADYAKAKKGMWALLHNKLDVAKRNAMQLRREQGETSQKLPTQLHANPWTNVDELILALESLRLRNA